MRGAATGGARGGARGAAVLAAAAVMAATTRACPRTTCLPQPSSRRDPHRTWFGEGGAGRESNHTCTAPPRYEDAPLGSLWDDDEERAVAPPIDALHAGLPEWAEELAAEATPNLAPLHAVTRKLLSRMCEIDGGEGDKSVPKSVLRQMRGELEGVIENVTQK